MTQVTSDASSSKFLSTTASSLHPPSLPPLTRSSQVLDLSGDLDISLRSQGEASSFTDAITEQRDVLLEAHCVLRKAQHGASCMGERCGLILGAPRQTAPQEVRDRRVTALLPALRRQKSEQRTNKTVKSPIFFQNFPKLFFNFCLVLEKR